MSNKFENEDDAFEDALEDVKTKSLENELLLIQLESEKLDLQDKKEVHQMINEFLGNDSD